MNPFIGEIILFGGNFAPRGWAFCNGQLLPIAQNTALFSILGTTYGGDGRTTFALPDLRGRAAIHPGNGPGLSSYRLGEKGGSETNTLTVNQIPAHSHSIGASEEATATDPNSGYVAGTGAAAFATSTDVQLKPTGNTGGGQSVNNIQPYECVNFIIALQGTFPSRS